MKTQQQDQNIDTVEDDTLDDLYYEAATSRDADRLWEIYMDWEYEPRIVHAIAGSPGLPDDLMVQMFEDGYEGDLRFRTTVPQTVLDQLGDSEEANAFREERKAFEDSVRKA